MLKNCPNCGCQPERHTNSRGKVYYECGECWTSTHKYWAEYDAINEWNSKIEDPPIMKPCPFCGGEVRAWWNIETYNYDIECESCNCDFQLHYETMDETIEAWNRRNGT